jgi:hypothetical protein
MSVVPAALEADAGGSLKSVSSNQLGQHVSKKYIGKI